MSLWFPMGTLVLLTSFSVPQADSVPRTPLSEEYDCTYRRVRRRKHSLCQPNKPGESFPACLTSSPSRTIPSIVSALQTKASAELERGITIQSLLWLAPQSSASILGMLRPYKYLSGNVD